MLRLKYVLVLFTIPLLAIAGFLKISGDDNSFSQQNSSDRSHINSIDNGNPHFTEKFYHYEYLINQTEIDSKKIQSEVTKFKNEVEKDYLSGLLIKRQGKFTEAFNFLVKHLNSLPPSFHYYDDLVNLANTTDNLTSLISRLHKIEQPENKYYIYLMGLIEFKERNYKKAVEIWSSLISSEQASKEVYLNLASAYRGMGDYQNGLSELTNTESLIDSSNFYFPQILNSKGALFYLSSEYDIAEDQYQKAYRLAIELSNTIEEIKALTGLAILRDTYGDVAMARDHLKKSLTKASGIENHSLIALLYSELGVSYTYTNNIVEARKNYEKSYEIYSLLKNKERLSYLSSNIASIYLQETNYKYALKYYNEGLKFAGNNLLGRIMSTIGIADVYSNEANYAQALNYYQQAKQLADSVKDVSSLIKINEGLGALYFNVNRPYKSLGFFKEAKKIISSDELPYEITELYYKTGVVLTSIDSFELAKDYFINGLKITEKSNDIYYNIILNTELAHIYYNLDEINKAKTILTSAKTEAEKYELTQLVGLQQLYLGKFLETEKNQTDAIRHFKASFEISDSATDFNTQIDAGFSLAKIFDGKNETELAEKWYHKTINLIDNISFPLVLNQEIQISHFSGFDEVYNSLVEFYIKQNKMTEAFEIIEQSRSRNTMLNLNKLKLLSSIEDAEKISEYFDLEWMISSGLYDEVVVDSLKKKSFVLKSYFEKNNKKLDYYLSKNPWRSVNDIKNSLDENENLITVYVGKKFTQLFLLTNKKLSSIKIETGRDSLISLLEQIAPMYRTDLTSRETYINQDLFSFNAKASWNLFNILFSKLFEEIPVTTTLIFNLPSELILMPVEFLVTDWKEDESPYYYKDKKFLIMRYPVLYTPSASIYIEQKGKNLEKYEQNLLVGEPNISNDDFTISYRGGLLEDDNFSTRNINLFPLKYSGTEIENINGIVSNGLVFLSEEATETNFKLNAPGSKIIHLSTHSLLYKDQPLIIFSQQDDGNDDGYLEVGEILQLDLNSDLVVLSSCRSGLGKIDEAEGILGMQKAFFEAGASSIIVSLWDVNDKYTSYFMKEFYESLGDGFNKSEALRKAKLSFIRKYSANPYYWAAFVLSGNPSVIEIKPNSTFSALSYLLIILFSVLIISLIYYNRNPHTS